MKLHCLAIAMALLLPVSVLVAADWDSPIDEKYRQQNPDLFTRYLQAQQLIDGAGSGGGRLGQARVILDGILENDPKFAPAYPEQARQIIKSGYLGNGRFEQGTLQSAQMALMTALSIEPDYADAYSLLGHVYTLAGKFDTAESMLTKAEEIGSGSTWLDMNWADLLSKQGRDEEAYRRYLNVIEQGVASQSIMNTAITGVMRYFEAQRDYAEAERWYLKGLEMDPESAAKWANYAAFQLYSLGDDVGAMSSAEKALASLDSDAVRKILANALYTQWARGLDQGRPPEDLRILAKRALGLYPDVATAAQTLARYDKTRFAAVKVFEQFGLEPGKALQTPPYSGLYDVQARNTRTQSAKDPIKAWNMALAQQDATLRFHMMREALSIWADTDPQQAIAYTDRLPPGSERSTFHSMALTNAAANQPLEILERLDTFSNSNDRRTVLRQAMRALGETEGAAAIARAENFYSVDQRKLALDAAYRGWASVDLLVATDHFAREQALDEYPAVAQALLETYQHSDARGGLRWAEQIEGPGGSLLWSRAVSTIAAQRPEEALAILAEVPLDKESQAGIENVLETLAETNPELTLTYVEQLPVESLRANIALRAAKKWAESDPLGALEWATTQPPAIQSFVYPSLTTKLARADLQFVLDIPVEDLPEEAREKWVSNVFAVYSKQDPDGAAAWIEQFSGHPMYPNWRTDVAYRKAQTDPWAALESLADLEASPRVESTMAAVVGLWTRKDPMAAAEWLMIEYAGDSRIPLTQTLLAAWSLMDYSAAKRWALGLPDDRELDAAIGVLYRSQAQADPRSEESRALLRLITDEETVFSVVQPVVIELARHDPADADDYIRSLNLGEIKERQLRSLIEQFAH